jgi:hypothetical protein
MVPSPWRDIEKAKGKVFSKPFIWYLGFVHTAEIIQAEDVQSRG